jgi:dolichol-phosphate mannosyltransferase
VSVASGPGSASTGRAGVVIPSYKEAENIAPLIQAVLSGIPEARVVVVDDSPDLGTVESAEGLHLPQVTVVHRGEKGGRGSAVLHGLRILLEQGCEQLIEMDADFSHPPAQIPELLAKARQEKIDLLIASRYVPSSRILNWPLTRHLFSRSSNWLARLLLRVPVRDYTNGYRTYSRRAAETIVESCGRLGKGFISLSEILVNCYYRGFTVAEVPTVFTNRSRGESSVTAAEVRNAIAGLYRIFLLKRQLQGDRWLIGSRRSSRNG